jgi:hypothetical protein
MIGFGDVCLSLTDDPGFFPLINTAPWNKLFRSELLTCSEASYEPPRIMDDMAIHAAFMPLCDRVAFLGTPLYTY